MKQACDRLFRFPCTYRDACLQYHEAQRYWLMANAFCDFCDIIAASNDANKHLRKHNESEIKQQWQSILRAVVNACPVIEGRYLDAM